MDLITLQNAIILGNLFYGLTIGIHALVIGKIIPYQNVNGGRSTSYAYQKKLSIISIIIVLFGLIFININVIFPGIVDMLFYSIISLVFATYWVFGYILQWSGTLFEKRYISWVLIPGILSHLILGIIRFI